MSARTSASTADGSAGSTREELVYRLSGARGAGARAHYAEWTRRSVGESGVAGLRGRDRSSGSVCSGHSSQRQSGAVATGGLGVSGS